MSNLDTTASAATAGEEQGLQDVLDFLVTEEALGVTFVTAAIGRAPGTPSEAFLPVLRNGVTQEYHHVQALKDAGGTQLTTRYWFPDAAFDNGGVRLFSTLEVVETVEISLYLLGVSAYARAGEDDGARLCAEAMGDRGRPPRARAPRPERAGQARRRAQRCRLRELRLAERGRRAHRARRTRHRLRVEIDQPGRFYDRPGDPLASGVGTPVSHTTPA